MEFVNFYLTPGIVLGCIYALGAIGISLTFGILRFSNFAHGDTMTFGVYITLTLVPVVVPSALWLADLFGQSGLGSAFGDFAKSGNAYWHPIVVAPVAMAITAIFVIGIDRWFYRPFREAPTIMLVIASFGMMLMIRSAVQFIWGVQLQPMVKGFQMPVGWLDPLRIPPKHLLIVSGTLILMFACHLMLTRTRIGKAMRATSDSPELAKVTGIDTEKVIRATWIMGSCLAVAAGIFLAIDTHVETNMGFQLLLPMFAAAILGGIGKPYGAVVGGLIIGIAEEVSAYPLFGTAPLVNPGYKAGVAFAIMVVMLIWRPQGLFRGRQF